jgi:hypothetical protein
MDAPNRLTPLPGGWSPADAIGDIRQVIDEHLVPATAELQRMADTGDTDGVRACSYELLVLAGTIIAACPPITGDDAL